MSIDTLDIKDQILLCMLDDVPFDGWTLDVLDRAMDAESVEKELRDVLFPEKIDSVLAHFANWADRQMLGALTDVNLEDMRIRDAIKMAVLERFKALQPHKDAVQQSLNHWAMPLKQIKAGKILWRSADCIWNWAGDTATDYNHYTKRTLLSGVMGSTTLAWLKDHGEDMAATEKFLDARIENVMQIGKIMGKLKKRA